MLTRRDRKIIRMLHHRIKYYYNYALRAKKKILIPDQLQIEKKKKRKMAKI